MALDVADSLQYNSVIVDGAAKPGASVSVEVLCTDRVVDEKSTIELMELCSHDVTVSSSVDTSQCSNSNCLASSLHLHITSDGDKPKRDLPLVLLPPAQSFYGAFSPQTPCSRFDSCVLHLTGISDCACIAGAVLCRWDNIVGPRIMYVWSTSVAQQSWLAAQNVLGYIARGTLAGEVNRNPRDEVKLFASSDSDLALATIVFSCHNNSSTARLSSDVSLYSMSVIVPYCELTSFLRLKSIYLEWLSRAVLQLRVLLSQVSFHFVSVFKPLLLPVQATNIDDSTYLWRKSAKYRAKMSMV